MPDKLYLFPSNKMASCMESGFSLVEVMVAMVIFIIAAAGVDFVLVSSNQQLTTVEYALQNQQYGMQATLVSATGSTASVGGSVVQPQPKTVNVTIATTPPNQPQACTSSLTSILLNSVICILGGSCGSATAPTASSVLVQVPTASLSSSFPALPSNRQPPVWWLP